LTWFFATEFIMSSRVAIVSTARTPFTRAHKGELRETRPDTLAAMAIKAAMDRAPGLDPAEVDDVILGCAFPEAEQGMNVARTAALMAGLPNETSGMTINRFCSSGVQTIATGAQQILAGSSRVVIAGGTESMTMIPMGGNKVSANPDVMANHPEIYISMGATAENVAAKFGVTRETQDAFAAESQRRAAVAQKEGKLSDEIFEVTVKVTGPDGEIHEITLDHDTINRPDTTVESLARLRPAFRPTGTVTAGNASPLTDGAAAAVLMMEEHAKELGLKPLGYYKSFVVAGVEPELMGIGPVPAIRKLLKLNNLTIDDIDIFEINEAFAAQASYCVKELGIDPKKVNPNGGAMALGHPLGVSGTRMVGTLLRELNRTGGKLGVVSMCIGGGMGAAGLFEAA
jgi:acetyl-CoA acyltransferase